MIYLNLSELLPEMMLAEPVCNLNGVLLVDKGARVDGKSIRLLKSWGVKKVWVDGDDEEAAYKDIEAENSLRESIEKELLEKFSGTLEDEVMAEIMKAAGRQLQKRLLKE